jgi:hypothetical protein
LPSNLLGVELDDLDPDLELPIAAYVAVTGTAGRTMRTAIARKQLPVRREEDNHGRILIRVADFNDWTARRAAKAVQRLSPSQRKQLAELLKQSA